MSSWSMLYSRFSYGTESCVVERQLTHARASLWLFRGEMTHRSWLRDAAWRLSHCWGFPWQTAGSIVMLLGRDMASGHR
ncbi:hypothetical protein, partial [Ornithinimicrobium sp.]|uniref:hypothetical protein n=1 Tax=Ornithinimicrobium sp. TaxID=1977084 RepID=UPI003D9AE73F